MVTAYDQALRFLGRRDYFRGELVERVVRAGRAAGGKAEKAAGLAAGNADAGFPVALLAVDQEFLVDFRVAHLLERLHQQRNRVRQDALDLPEGGADEHIPQQNRQFRAFRNPEGGQAAAFEPAINHIIMQQAGRVQHLHAGGRDTPVLRRQTGCRTHGQDQPGAQHLAAADLGRAAADQAFHRGGVKRFPDQAAYRLQVGFITRICW